jgi:hypothetical protein
VLALVLGVGIVSLNAQTTGDGVWERVNKQQLRQPGIDSPALPDNFEAFSLNKAKMRVLLDRAPDEHSKNKRIIVTLPMPDGTLSRFRIERSLVVEPGLLARYPELGATYRAYGIDDPTASARVDLLPSGFHSMVLSSSGTVIVDPYANDTTSYISYFKRNRKVDTGFFCETGGDGFDSIIDPKTIEANQAARDTAAPELSSGTQLRTYRLALASTNEYCTAVGNNTIAGCLAAEVLIMNRVNGVYERDLAIHMNIVANNNLITFAGDNMACGGVACTASNDPYTNSTGTTMLGENQTEIDTVIGSANYDIGHVFSTGGGGVAGLGVTCSPSGKARGVIGLPNPVGDDFAIDFVAHEMGHQFGAQHTFNGTSLNCGGGNRSSGSAYEPGSGITVMAYAGICGNQDLAAHSIDTFHVKSLEDIIAYSQSGTGNTCAVTTSTGDTPPTVPNVGGPYNIPMQTPFSLTASSTDIDNDTITYDWQEYDLGNSTTAVPNTDAGGAMPIFRPYLPTTSGTRTFPSLQYILSNADVPASTYGASLLTGELLPQVSRTMTFKVIARDNHAGGGGINTAAVTVNVDGNSGPFAVTSPNTNVTYQGNSSQTISWNVAGTNAAPVNASNLDILLSTDGGTTFPTVLASAVPNNGNAVVKIPIVSTTSARVMVKATGNIFFDVSDANFTISGVAAPVRARADFDGDGKTDLSVFRPSEGNWYVFQSRDGLMGLHWGLSIDTPVPADYNNDGKADFAVARLNADPTKSFFYVLTSGSFTVTVANFGVAGDIPVVGDYDGDGKADIAVWRPSNSTWYIQKSTGGLTTTVFGDSADTPVVGDFDGDGKADLTVWTPSNGFWKTLPSSGGSTIIVPSFGLATDKPVPADYNGDGKDDYAVFRPSNGTWYRIDPVRGQVIATQYGLTGDIPVPGDYDGDGIADVAVYRPSNGTWYLNRSTAGLFQIQYGIATDIPIPSKYIP